jgi:hypothetical protein
LNSFRLKWIKRGAKQGANKYNLNAKIGSLSFFPALI